jgi:outer membrane protein assembly factor BamD (BamD/ComL family)
MVVNTLKGKKQKAKGKRQKAKGVSNPKALWVFAYCLLPIACCLVTGCQHTSLDNFSFDGMSKPRVELPPPPSEAVFRAGHWEQDTPVQPGTLAGDFASAKVLFDRGEYADAEDVFHWLAKRAERKDEKSVMPQNILEQCLYYEAECLYAQGHYPKARDTYFKLLKEFPSSRFRSEAIRRQFDIADFWLKDTRTEMEEQKEVDAGTRWMTTPHFMHFAKEKPTFGEEDYAVKACEGIYTQDPAGSLAPEALYRAGGVSYYRERYKEADDYYSLIVDSYPKSPLAPTALELALQSKIKVTGGADYDSRKLAEARTLIDRAMRSYPEVKNDPEKRAVLQQTLVDINNQQAEKDFKIAEFYRRTNHPGAAYFQYEIVRRRYPGTDWADRAKDRLVEIRDKVELENAKK